MTEQLRCVDIHEYYRTGGIDWARVAANFDIVGIRACVGTRVDTLLPEHIDNCQAIGKPYFTYQVPVASIDPVYQADFYLDQYGVAEGLICEDIEPVSGVMISEYQARQVFERLAQQRSDPAWYYSNAYYTGQLGNPAWITEHPVFWAEYRYEYLRIKFRKFEPFLERYPWWQPAHSVDLGIYVTLHQFTDYGDARYYLANDRTSDPVYTSGIKSADLSVGLDPKEDILALWDALAPPAPPPANCCDLLDIRVSALELWVQEHNHPIDGDEPPPVIEPNTTLAAVNDEGGAVAWDQSGENDNGIPTIDINLWAKTNDPRYKFAYQEVVSILPEAVRGQSNTRWFKLADRDGFVNKKQVTQIT